TSVQSPPRWLVHRVSWQLADSRRPASPAVLCPDCRRGAPESHQYKRVGVPESGGQVKRGGATPIRRKSEDGRRSRAASACWQKAAECSGSSLWLSANKYSRIRSNKQAVHTNLEASLLAARPRNVLNGKHTRGWVLAEPGKVDHGQWLRRQPRLRDLACHGCWCKCLQ
ncbi:unnamed protein product, partial [Urochloa humidicola]